MIKKLILAGAFVFALSLASLASLSVTVLADGSVTWTGQGVSNGEFETEQCEGDTPNPGDVLWILTATGADSATITINGQTFDMTQKGNGAFHFVQSGFNGDFGSLNVSADWEGDANSGNPQLVISHGCPAENGNGNGNGNGREEEENGVTLGEQVEAPKGGVEAGAGGAAGSASVLIPGLVSSVAALGYGVLRLRNTE
ncbi:MAG TPA: hypothetical protein VI336_02435 [Candidatus Saccharimonadales bacterium]|nr:hypothetical protein [Candidatus Saccharimonadales bacterium]